MGDPLKTDSLFLCICPCVYVGVLVPTCVGKLACTASHEQRALLTTEPPLQPLRGLLKWVPFSSLFSLHLSLSPPFSSCIFFLTFWFPFIVSRQSYTVLLSDFELMISQSGSTLSLTMQTRKQRAFPASVNFLLLL